MPGTTLTVVAVDHAAEDKEEAARCQDIFAAAVLGKLGATRHFLRMDPGAACKTENCSHSTALHLAAHHGHVAICEVLLAARAEVDAMCLGRWSPLHSAAQNGQADAVKLLLEAKASVTRNEEGKTGPSKKKGQDRSYEDSGGGSMNLRYWQRLPMDS